MKIYIATLLTILVSCSAVYGTDYHVGPGQPLATISEVPWDALVAGDRIYIHWRSTPYYEKWVINAQGTEQNRIEIIGVSGTNGQKPVIDGNGAITPTYLDYWNENRSIIKIGGSSVPADGLPAYITIENLEIRSARPAYTFTTDNGQTATYASNAASIHIEKGEHILIKNCIVHDSGNGIFVGANGGQTKDILIANNYIYDNGIVGSIFEHNTYTEALGITYEYNRFGPLRAGALGNNLKDRSAGLVVRYNWIESGNRQLDLVDAGTSALYNDPSYDTTYAYGNILIEPDGAGNSQIMHYGGDSGTTSRYRKGDFYFYNNTVVSTRNSNTTLARLSTQDETMHAFNNAIYTTNNGSSLAMIDNTGTLNISYNWIRENWVDSHNGSPAGTVNDLGNNLEGADPLFQDIPNQDFSLQDASPLIDEGTNIPAIHLPDHDLLHEYVLHTSSLPKQIVNMLDVGAFENLSSLPIELLFFAAYATDDKTVDLTWQTASEINNDFFEIERSPDGKDWKVIETIAGAGTSSTKLSYGVKDELPFIGVNYYRLKQVDYDGRSTYSSIQHVNIKTPKETKVIAYPNPVSALLSVKSEGTALSGINIYDVSGKDVTPAVAVNYTDEFNATLDVKHLVRGVYFLQAANGHQTIIVE